MSAFLSGLAGAIGGLAIGVTLLMRERARMRPVHDADMEVRRLKGESQRDAKRIRAEAEQDAATTKAQAEQQAAALRDAAAAKVAEAEREALVTREHTQALLASAGRETTELRTSITSEREALRKQVVASEARLAETEALCALAMTRFEKVMKELESVEERLDVVDVGHYNAHFTYEDSEQYKENIAVVRDRQASMIKEGLAAICAREWTVDGDRRAGERMLKGQIKMLLRAFNAEAEAAIANVTWSNYDTMIKRIEKAADALNKFGRTMEIAITQPYIDFHLLELRLVFEAAEKKKEEKDRQRAERAAQREEDRVQREFAKAQVEAEKEEDQYERALERARAELLDAQADQQEAMVAHIAELQAKLAEAHERKERAIAQAQLTKVGHVYIISNTGAFGEGVVKIGMTRRLEPEERIQELGDASVPFPFDLHALIFSENAPEMEARLHNHFWDRRVNWANDRKEFFRVSVTEVRDALANLSIQSDVRLMAEAREYRETLALTRPGRGVAELAPAAPVLDDKSAIERLIS